MGGEAMAGIWIERGGFLREILHLLGIRDWDCQWLITGLECYDTCGWEGAEKWGQETLLLSNEAFLHDVEERDMQFVWGIFSAIPGRYSKKEIFSYAMPDFQEENGRSVSLREHLLPQHSLAFLEILSEDSTSVTVISPETEVLQPLYGLSCWTEDAEKSNRCFLAAETAVKEFVAARGYGKMKDYIRRNLSCHVWHSLYHHRPDRPFRQEEVEAVCLRYWNGELE